MKRMRFFLTHLLCLGLSLLSTGGDAQERFVYSGFSSGTNLTLDGVAGVTADGKLELTNGTLQRKGHAFYPAPLRFSPNRSFSASFVFGILSDHAGLSAHGMAFVVSGAGVDFSAALPSGYLGLLNVTSNNNGSSSNRLFAVELDTMQNDEFGDLNDNHVGVDVNSLRSLQSYSAGYFDDNGEFRNLTLISGEAMQVWVEYDGESTQINVTMAPLNVAKPARPLVSAKYDLSTVLTDASYVGFSAATGGTLRSRHYVLGWSFGMDGPAPAIDIGALPKLPPVGPKDRSRVLEIVLPLATAAFLLAVGAVLFVLVRRHRRYAELLEDWEDEFGPHRFMYKDLFHATEGFKSSHLLGIGGFGRVYKGVLPVSKSEIAVKRVSHGSKQGMKEFIAEVVSLGRLQHRNLVQLHGYCRRKGELLLVYENMSNGSLDKYLHANDQAPHKLDWVNRFRIIKGIASGLVYLHHEWEKVVIHRDIKASNVLLDDEMNGRLGDFGLARLYDHGSDPLTTHVVGTIGYIAPELGRNGKASPLTDIFAFGVFMLEVTCGQRPVKQGGRYNQVLLVDWVLQHWQNGSLLDTVDIRLQGNYDANEASLVLKLGLLCTHPFSNARPRMHQIMQYLDGDMPLPEMVPTHQISDMVVPFQTEEFHRYDTANLLSKASNGTISSLSGGR